MRIIEWAKTTFSLGLTVFGTYGAYKDFGDLRKQIHMHNSTWLIVNLIMIVIGVGLFFYNPNPKKKTCALPDKDLSGINIGGIQCIGRGVWKIPNVPKKVETIRITKNLVDQELAVMRLKINNQWLNTSLKMNENEHYSVQAVDLDDSTGRGIIITGT